MATDLRKAKIGRIRREWHMRRMQREDHCGVGACRKTSSSW